MILSGGIFVGLCDEIPRKLAETMVVYSDELYFDICDLEHFIKSLACKKLFHSYVNRMSEIRKGLTCPPVGKVDQYLSANIQYQ